MVAHTIGHGTGAAHRPPGAGLPRWAGRVGLSLLALGVLALLALTVGPRVFHYQTYYVKSGSMAPALGTGSLIVLRPVHGETLRAGDVITVRHPGKPGEQVTHRIIGEEDTERGRAFITKGDANPEPDDWRVPASGVGWRYEFGIPYAGYVFHLFTAVQVRLAFVIVPAMLLCLWTVAEIWRPRRQERAV